MKYFVGLDIGTSQIKAVLFDSSGNEVAVSSHKTEILSPAPKWMEQDMDQIWDVSAYCLRTLIAHAPCSAEDIIGVGLSGQGEGLWLIDEKGQPLQNAILWSDGRSANVISNLSESDRTAIRRLTFTTPVSARTLMQLKWMKEHREDVLKQARYCFFCKDWIRYKLTDQLNMDRTDPSVTMLDMNTQEICDPLLTLLGLDGYRELFPDMINSSDPAGLITRTASEKTGLPPGIPVAAGALDVTATAIGVNAMKENDLFLILGTTACSGLIQEKSCATVESGKYILHPNSENWIKIMATMAGTPNIDWMTLNIACTDNLQHIESVLVSTSSGSGGIIYLPYISPAGERYPFYHPNAMAGFFGITQSTTREELVRAVFEGVAMSVKDCLQGETTSGRIHVAGGGSKNDPWCQIMADCTHHEIVRFRGNEFGAKGAAILGAIGAGWHGSLASLSKSFCHEDKRFTPNPKNSSLYDDLYGTFKSLQNSQSEIWDSHQKVINAHSLR